MRAGPLEVHGKVEAHCYGETGEIDIIVGVTRVKNTSSEPLTTTGVKLVGDGEVSLTEGAIMPFEYNVNGRSWYYIGAGYYPPPEPVKIPKWHEARESIPGAVIEPGDTVDFAYRASLTPPAKIDHTELSYEDPSGNEFIAADTVTVNVDWEGTGCAA